MQKAKTKIYTGILISTFLSVTTYASVIKKNKVELDTQTVSIQFPSATTHLNDIEANLDTRNSLNSKAELTFSSWMPREIRTASRIQVTSPYQSSVPSLTANVLHPLNSVWFVKWGATVAAYKRTATFSSAGISTTEDQMAYFTAARIGFEYEPHWLTRTVFQPYFSAVAMPSLLFTNHSAFSDGENAFGVPLEGSAGMLVSITENFQLNFAALAVYGNVGTSIFTGQGLELGLRVNL